MAAVSIAVAQTTPDPGQDLFTERCAVCHGAVGDGGSAPDLTNAAWQSHVSDADLEKVIRDGAPGTAMPAFGGRWTKPRAARWYGTYGRWASARSSPLPRCARRRSM